MEADYNDRPRRNRVNTIFLANISIIILKIITDNLSDKNEIHFPKLHTVFNLKFRNLNPECTVRGSYFAISKTKNRTK